MENIFINSDFGDKFILKNGKCSVLLNNSNDEYCLACEDGHLESHYRADGTLPEEYGEYGREYKIIGRKDDIICCHKINEDKLAKLAKEFAYNEVSLKYEEFFHKPFPTNRENFGFICCEKAYKAGFRKAMEE